MFEYTAEIVRWVDGDTVILKVDLGFRVTTETDFRLNGINTPERGQPGYREAIEFVNTHFPVGSTCRIKTYKTDKYGRWLVDILYDSNSSLNGNLVLNELAVWYYGGKKS